MSWRSRTSWWPTLAAGTSTPGIWRTGTSRAEARSAHHRIGRLPPVGAGTQEARLRVQKDRLHRARAPGEGGPHLDIVAAALQLLDRRGRQAVLDVQPPGQMRVRRKRIREAEGREARLLDRFLDVHAEME